MSAPSARRKPLALAHEIAELRAEYRTLLERVPKLAEFEVLWDQFVERLRPLVDRLHDGEWEPAEAGIAEEVAAVDELRLDLMGRQSTALSAYRDPLNMILHTSLRTPSPALYRYLFGRAAVYQESGVVHLPVVDLPRFNAQVAEARADIVRERRELDAEIQRAGTRLHELQDALPSLVSAMLRSWLWRNWRRRLATSAGAVLVGAVTPPIRTAAVTLFQWIRSLF